MFRRRREEKNPPKWRHTRRGLMFVIHSLSLSLLNGWVRCVFLFRLVHSNRHRGSTCFNGIYFSSSSFVVFFCLVANKRGKRRQEVARAGRVGTKPFSLGKPTTKRHETERQTTWWEWHWFSEPVVTSHSFSLSLSLFSDLFYFVLFFFFS